MSKSIWRGAFNRLLHQFARRAPGAQTLRPRLHRLRGVTVEDGVFIGDDVYIDNEYPECVELLRGCSVSVRAILIAHTRGPGRLILERDCFVGPNAVICCSSGKLLRIGEGAVISAGAVITRSVAPRTMVAPPPSRPVARLTVPFTNTTSMEDFLAGMQAIAAPTRGDFARK